MKLPSELVHIKRFASYVKKSKGRKPKIKDENIQLAAIAFLVELAALMDPPEINIFRNEGYGNSGFGEAGYDMIKMFLIWSKEETIEFSIDWHELRKMQTGSPFLSYRLMDENLEFSIGGDGGVQCKDLERAENLASLLRGIARVKADEDPDFELPDKAKARIRRMARRITESAASGRLFPRRFTQEANRSVPRMRAEENCELPLIHVAELGHIIKSGVKYISAIHDEHLKFLGITVCGELSALLGAANICIKPTLDHDGYSMSVMWPGGEESGIFAVDLSALKAGRFNEVLSVPPNDRYISLDRFSNLGAEMSKLTAEHDPESNSR